MIEFLVALLMLVITVTIVGHWWSIWKPVLKWAAIAAGVLAIIGAAVFAVLTIRDEMRIATAQKAKQASEAEWRQNGEWKNDPLYVPVSPFTEAVAKRNGFQLRAFTIRASDGQLLSVTDVDETSARAAGEAWAKQHPRDKLISDRLAPSSDYVIESLPPSYRPVRTETIPAAPRNR